MLNTFKNKHNQLKKNEIKNQLLEKEIDRDMIEREIKMVNLKDTKNKNEKFSLKQHWNEKMDNIIKTTKPFFYDRDLKAKSFIERNDIGCVTGINFRKD